MDKCFFDVSVVIPCYNGEKFIAGAVQSVLDQILAPREIIVVNDGSTDGTEQVLNRFGQDIEVVSQQNLGLPGARNAGLKIAQGEWVAFLDADDRWEPDMVANLSKAVKACSDVDIWFADFWHVTPDGKIIDRGTERHAKGLGLVNWECVDGNFRVAVGSVLYSIVSDFWPCSSVFVLKKSLAKSVGGYSVTCSRCEDLDIYLKLVPSDAVWGFVDKSLARIVQNPNSLCRGLSGSKMVSESVVSILTRFMKENHLSNKEVQLFKRVITSQYLNLSWINQIEGNLVSSRKFACSAISKGAWREGVRLFLRSLPLIGSIKSK